MDRWNEVPESSSMLDVLDANLFTGVSFEPAYIEETEKNFYRGAPPSWLNFHISDQAASNGTGTPIIKREGYEALRQKIEGRRRTGIAAVKLLHQPGCGGTTLAMQVLWDLRKTFNCAVLKGSTLDIASVAKEVVQLFTTGSWGQQRTVLLLVNDEQILENLQNSIMEEIAQQGIATRGTSPAVTILSCVRKDTVVKGENVVLKKVLSNEERQKFNDKQTELGNRYPDQCKQFHGFNIMLADSPQAYVTQACTVFRNVRSANKPRKTQLAAFLSLLNAYVPGSYLLESQCLNFLKPEEHGDVSLQDRMKPFSHLIITFQQDTTSERRVRMAHPVIAQCCTELLAQAKVDRSDTARNFLTYFCRDEVPPCLLNFIKDMLTKRETKIEENTQCGTDIKDNKGNKEKFSRLILDIKKIENRVQVNGKTQSASVLKVASNKFSENPFFPQALARFYYIEIKDYNLAEMWAERAKKRDHKNSFIADTLGQIHKNHLNSFSPRPGNLRNQTARPRRLLRLATKAIKAFKHEEKLAEDEEGPDMNKDGMRNISNVFNTRGQFGYLQVCNILYDLLVSQNEIWKKVLTCNKPMGSVLKSLGDNKLFKFNDLIKSLRDDVKRKCDFFNNYLTYSRPGMQEEDPSYIRTIASSCHRQYTEEALPDPVSGIMNEFTKDENTITAADTPERYIVALLKRWTNENNTQNNSSDLMQLIEEMSHLYKRAYAKYFRSRYLCPVLFLGKGQALGSIVPTTCDDFWLENEDATTDFFNYMKQKDKIFKDLRVQQQLFKFHGRVEEYHVCTSVGKVQIQVKANMQESVWIPREVSFYLGFTIGGLVALGIQTIKNDYGHPKQDLGQWTATEPQCTIIHGVTTYSLQSGAGQFQCSVSALRWVCKKKVRFTYQFRSWEEHTQKLNMVHCKPAGPLLDITVNEGRFDEVYLPHWICIVCSDGFQTVSDKFAVLHRDTSGNFLEQVSEVMSSHVKSLLYRFSTHGVLVRARFPVKAHCSVLIFKTKQPILTFHIHLIPCDAALRQTLEQQERDGSILIHKSNPEKPLQMLDSFSLTTNAKTKISPAEIQLGHEQANFFTVNSTSDQLMLTLKHAGEDVWSCEI
ncbi:sterile alpha motif domain-containing protein 9-like [Mastacembelus armatus]|uniref:Sterile alpha motif domain-containing protein 9-like n=1 Tax=Mastacembelus armatus TaxID=205130 RepID=A0A3Q3S4Z1_9TELE|nr:sterile alpha motif domain-containing protein 9-like [Mastacembelus armatus]